MKRDVDICIVGGCGHVGLPLGLAFANKGKTVVLEDINEESVKMVNAGRMPFMEHGAKPILTKSLKSGRIRATTDPTVIKSASNVIVVIGTPIDERLDPRTSDVYKAIREIESYLSGEQLLILSSTLYPGTTQKIYQYLRKADKKTLVAFCPERIAQGHAIKELYELPQIVSGCTGKAVVLATSLFKVLTKKIVTMEPTEAELAKLFTNAWRYINFATSNQFYMLAQSNGLDFYKIYNAVTKDYPRMQSFAKAGLTAGPCLFKDTMQLSAFSGNNFFLGHSAMLVNEGLPDFIVKTLQKNHNLTGMKVGLLGMAFKGDSDDPRTSLAFKLKKKLELESAIVLCHDPYIKDPSFVSLDTIRKKADIIILSAPHSIYKNMRWKKEVIDVWGFYKRRSLLR
ncbi:MAG TPA: nucleotide sugar dehydrogenase, partial [Candidatus Paceibacterota bacterium]